MATAKTTYEDGSLHDRPVIDELMVGGKAIIASVLLVFGVCMASIADNPIPVLAGIEVKFELVNRDSEIVSYQDFRGRNVLLAFGFTHCLHICPLIAANMASALRISEKEAIGVFISVDTERDTPEITDTYARGFSDKLLGFRLFDHFYAITEYRINEFRLSEKYNLALGVEYKFRW